MKLPRAWVTLSLFSPLSPLSPSFFHNLTLPQSLLLREELSQEEDEDTRKFDAKRNMRKTQKSNCLKLLYHDVSTSSKSKKQKSYWTLNWGVLIKFPDNGSCWLNGEEKVWVFSCWRHLGRGVYKEKCNPCEQKRRILNRGLWNEEKVGNFYRFS